MHYFIGIDPGLEGALSVVDNDMTALVIYDTPLIAGAGTKKRPEHDLQGIKGILNLVTEKYMADDLFAMFERLWSRPGQSAQSGFSLGRGAGLWEMGLVFAGIRYEPVTPQRWQKEMLHGVEDKGKEASWLRARQLFPDAIPLLEAKRPGGKGRRIEHGRSDALLIAEHARRVYNAGQMSPLGKVPPK